MPEPGPALSGDGSQGSVLARPDRVSGIAAALKWLLVGVSVWYIGSYLVVALLRIGYPFELEWMEGAVANHVLGILNGRPLYVPPSLEFVPFIYAPFYYYVSAGLAMITGFSLFPLRLVSLLSSLACLGIIYAFVRRETGSRFFGLVAAALFAATFRAAGAWLDIARADSLFLALSLAGLYLVRFSRSGLGLAAAGALFALAFHTKQTALFIALPVMAWSLATHRRRSLPFVVTFSALAGVAVPVLNSIYHGWYYYYVFFLPAHGTFLKSVLWEFWIKDLLWVMPVACVLAVVLLARRRTGLGRGIWSFYVPAGAGLVATAWFGRLHHGGYSNALLPAFVGLAILGVMGASVLTRPPDSPEPKHRALATVVYLACIVQFGLLWYNPATLIPSRQDARAGRELVATLAGFQGELFMPHHGYLPELAGKRSCAHQMAICDVLNAGPSEVGNRLLSEIGQAIEQHRFSAIVIDHPFLLQDVILAHYRVQSRAFSTENVFWPRTGVRTRPEFILVPRAGSQPSPADSANSRP